MLLYMSSTGDNSQSLRAIKLPHLTVQRNSSFWRLSINDRNDIWRFGETARSANETIRQKSL